MDEVSKNETDVNASSSPLDASSLKTSLCASVSGGMPCDLSDASKIASTVPAEADKQKHVSPPNSLLVASDNSLAIDAKLLHSMHAMDAAETENLDISFHHQNKSGERTNLAEVKAALASLELTLGSLTRTKESIGRATRIAVDCVKFGCASEVW